MAAIAYWKLEILLKKSHSSQTCHADHY